jgi:hypothetical protein
MMISRPNSPIFSVSLAVGNRKRYIHPLSSELLSVAKKDLKTCFGFIPAKGKTYDVEVMVRQRNE